MSESPVNSYEGERNEQFERQGTGKATYTNGDYYDGQFEHGKRSGTGIYKYMENEKQVAIYSGSWLNGNKEGQGKFSYTNGGVYEGSFSNGERDGLGIYTYPNMDHYKGQWKQNKKNGEGEYFKFESKIVVRGTWVDGVITGSIKISREDGELEGEVEDGALKTYKFLTIDGASIAVEQS